jgi:subfamily B ATP-binding cassette protein MsbA
MQHERQVLFKSFRKYWPLAALTVGFSLLRAGAEVFSIGMLIPFLQTLSGEGAGAFQTGVAWIDQHVLAVNGTKVERMYRICGIILVATWMRSVFGYLGGWHGTKTRARVVEDLRMRVVDQLQAVSLRFFSTTRSGELINSLRGEMGRVASMLAVLIGVTQQGLMIAAYLTFMFAVSWSLSLLVLVFFGLLAVGLTRLIQTVREHGEKMTEANGRYTSTTSEFIDGIRTVTAYNMQSFERKRLREAARGVADTVIATTQRSLAVRPLSQGVVSTLLIVVVVVAVQFFVLSGALTMAPLLAFLFAMFRLMPAVHQLNNQRGQWAQDRGALDNVADLLRRDDKPYLEEGSREAAPLKEGITFRNVDFAYEPGEPVLNDVNLVIPRGETTALVGATGAGKSTLADLVPRFYDPTEGQVLYDGVDMRAFKVRSLRARMAVVSQDTYIFNDTVEANIGYGDPEASFEQIVEVADRANALGFVGNMKEGFGTVLGERGVKLSGGQRQRVAIARALLRDPEILILDEATSALDSVTEKQVQESLEKLMEGRTVIAIAHRLSTVEDADQVVVLEEGRIVEQGGYQELLERRGQLWEYHSVQYQMA